MEKTVFILELLLDPQLRHRQERGLNDGEAVNSASRAIFVGQRGEFRDRAYQDQVHRASCLHLLVAAIGAWTTPYLAQSQHPRHEVQGRHGRGHRGDERARAWQRMTAQAPGFAAYETSTDRQIPVIRLTTV